MRLEPRFPTHSLVLFLLPYASVASAASAKEHKHQNAFCLFQNKFLSSVTFPQMLCTYLSKYISN